MSQSMGRPMSSTPSHWRQMKPGDLPAVLKVADDVHPDFPEDDAVFVERLNLYPAGALVLERDGAVCGYLLSHPWHSGKPPALNTLLGVIPADADRYYIHDLALLPSERGTGIAGMAIDRMTSHARAARFSAMSLIAVNGSIPFWSRFGFVADESVTARQYTRSYDADARVMVRTLA